MRRVISVLAIMSVIAVKAMAGQSAPSACALLTKELLAAHSPASKQSFALMMKIPPQEEKAGAGTGCQFGDVMLQLDPFPVANFDRLFGKWSPVSGVGDRAYFRDNGGRWAELAVLAGKRMITIQMDVPEGKTSASIQPNTVALANGILQKLK